MNLTALMRTLKCKHNAKLHTVPGFGKNESGLRPVLFLKTIFVHPLMKALAQKNGENLKNPTLFIKNVSKICNTKCFIRHKHFQCNN